MIDYIYKVLTRPDAPIAPEIQPALVSDDFLYDLLDEHFIRMMKDFGEIDDGPLLNHKLGVDAARALNAKVSGIVQSTRETIIRIRPDLNYVPTAGATN